MLAIARAQLARFAPELRDEPIQLRHLDGPPDGPRYAVSVGICRRTEACPHGIAAQQPCPVLNCEQRQSLRMLLDRNGEPLELLRNGVRWESEAPTDTQPRKAARSRPR
jgi:hypothetical protein